MDSRRLRGSCEQWEPHVRCLTWNLHLGAASSEWMGTAEWDSLDVAFLQESHRPAGTGAVVWERVAGQSWGSAVAVAGGQIAPIPVPEYEGWVTGGLWRPRSRGGAVESICLFSVHTPTGRGPYVKENLAILDALGGLVPADSSLMIGGDFNLLSFGERASSESLVTTPAERRVLDRVAEMGLVSCWPQAHPGEPLPQTLRWSGDRSRPFHCDVILIPRSWAAGVQCEVLTGLGFEDLSDHAPVRAHLVFPMNEGHQGPAARCRP